MNQELTLEAVQGLTGRVVLEFGTDWCPHCQALQKTVAQLKESAAVPFQHFSIEDGKGKALGRAFRVKLWPNFVFLRDGQQMAQLARPSQSELQAQWAEWLL
jgi:thioredoxin 1